MLTNLALANVDRTLRRTDDVKKCFWVSLQSTNDDVGLPAWREAHTYQSGVGACALAEAMRCRSEDSSEDVVERWQCLGERAKKKRAEASIYREEGTV